MRGRGRKLVAIQTEAHARCVICALELLGVAWPAASSDHGQGIATAAKTRSRPTFLAIVLACSSNMTRDRSAAVVLGGESTKCWTSESVACLGLDCHEFSSAPVRAGAARLHRVCSASTLQKGIPDDASGGWGRRRCAVSGYARHAIACTMHARVSRCPPGLEPGRSASRTPPAADTVSGVMGWASTRKSREGGRDAIFDRAPARYSVTAARAPPAARTTATEADPRGRRPPLFIASVSECQMRHVTIIHDQTCAETTRPDGKQ